MDVISNFSARYERTREKSFPRGIPPAVQAQQDGLRHRRRAHAGGHRRARVCRYSQQPTLSRIFANKTIKLYPAFREFHGTEEVIEQVVSYFRTPHRAWKRKSRSFTCWVRWVAASPRSPNA